MEIQYYLNDYDFFSLQCQISDSVGTVLEIIKKKHDKYYINSLYLNGVRLNESKKIEEYKEELHYRAIFCSSEPANELILSNSIKLNFDNYKEIEKLKNHTKYYKGIDKQTNQNVLIQLCGSNLFWGNPIQLANLTRGIYIMSQFNLPSIPTILGYRFPGNDEEDESLKKYFHDYKDNILVTKFYENGSVLENVLPYLESNGSINDKMNPTIRSKIIFGVASTMKHLHEKHCILNSLLIENVMLDENFEPVISDFRFATFLVSPDHREDPQFLFPASLKYFLPPEICEESPFFRSQLDVFAFGAFVYRMFSKSKKISDIEFNDKRKIRSLSNYMMRISKGARPVKLDNIPDPYWELIESCWNHKPELRPTFKEIVETLKDDKFALEEFGMKTDLSKLHEYQNRIEADEISQLKAEISKLKKKIESIETPAPKINSVDIEIIDSDMISKLRTIREINTGGFAKVLEVGKEESYALKVIHSTDLDIEKMRSFLKEYEILNNLKHPFIVKTFGIFMGDEKALPSILLEYCVKDMKKAIKEKKETNETIVKWIYQIVEAMKYIHKFGIVHRDLKPSNILIGKDGDIRVSDFGISKLLSSEEQTTIFGAGTQYFMAPEILKLEKYNEKADVYSFGVLLYFILSGGEMPKINIIQIGNGVKAKIPDTFTPFAHELINNCWNLNPSERPSFEQIIDLLKNNDYNLLELTKSEVNYIKEYVKNIQKHIPK